MQVHPPKLIERLLHMSQTPPVEEPVAAAPAPDPATVVTEPVTPVAASPVVADATEGYSEVEKFLHELISEVATNARGYTASLEGRVVELEAKVAAYEPAVATLAKLVEAIKL